MNRSIAGISYFLALVALLSAVCVAGMASTPRLLQTPATETIAITAHPTIGNLLPACRLSWIFTELWESRALWDRHMDSAHLARYKAVVEEMAEYWTIFTGHMVRPGT